MIPAYFENTVKYQLSATSGTNSSPTLFTTKELSQSPLTTFWKDPTSSLGTEKKKKITHILNLFMKYMGVWDKTR